MGVEIGGAGVQLSGPIRSRSDMQRADAVHLELLVVEETDDAASRLDPRRSPLL